VAIVVSLSYVRKLRAYRATQTIRVLEDDLRAAQNRELSKTDQKLGVLTCTIETGMGSMIFPHRVQRMIDLKNSTCTDKYPRGSNSISACDRLCLAITSRSSSAMGRLTDYLAATCRNFQRKKAPSTGLRLWMIG
jgi:hypothetical protein